MRSALRIALEGSTILALAFFSAALHRALRSVRSQRTVVALNGVPNGTAHRTVAHARRPVFLSRRNLL